LQTESSAFNGMILKEACRWSGICVFENGRGSGRIAI